jgi:hypothetical protein
MYSGLNVNTVRNLIRNLSNLQEGQPVNTQTSLANALLNVTTRLLFRKRYISTEHTDEDCQEFPALVKKVMILSGFFNISDYVPYLKPFDLQGLTPQFKQTSSKMDRLFDRIIQDHLKETKTSDEPRDFLDVMLSLPGVEGASDRLDNMAIKGLSKLPWHFIIRVHGNHVSCPMHFIIRVWL